MVDNLGMAYGLTHQYDEALHTFEYGLSKNSTYPLFYFSLACTYAEIGDLDKALAKLGKAYQYQANILPGEKFPNPATDDSFKRYWDDPKFREFLKRMESN